MKVRRRLLKSVQYICIAIIIMCSMPVLSTGASEVIYELENDIGVSISIGVDGMYKYGRNTKIYIDAYSNGDAVNGTLYINLYDEIGNNSRYEFDINLAAGMSKSYSFDAVIRADVHISYTFVDENDEAHGTYEYAYNEISTEIYIGVMTDNYEDMAYLHSADLSGIANIDQVAFDMMSNEQCFDNISMFDLIIVQSLDVSRITDEMRDCITKYLLDGGGIIVASSDESAAYVSEFAGKYLDPEYEIADDDIYVYYDRDVNEYIEEISNYPDTMEIGFGNESTSILECKNLIESINVGTGELTLLKIDMNDSEFMELCKREGLLDTIISSAISDTMFDGIINDYYWSMVDDYYVTADILSNVFSKDIPNLFIYGIVLFSYVLIIIPGMYLFLKRRDKLERFNVCVVGTALIFTGIIFYMGKSTRFSGPFALYSSYIYITDEQIVENVLTDVKNPYGENFTARFDEKYEIKNITRINNYAYANEEQTVELSEYSDYQVSFNVSQKNEITFNECEAFESQYFRLNDVYANADKRSVDTDIVFYDQNMEGTITNNTGYDMTECYIIMSDRYVPLGNMKAGSTLSVDTYDIKRYELAYTDDTAQAILGTAEYSRKNQLSEYIKSLSKANMLQSFMEDVYNHGYDDNKKYFFVGFTDEGGIDTEGLASTYGTTIVMTQLDISNVKNNLCYEIINDNIDLLSGSYMDSTHMSGKVLEAEYPVGEDVVAIEFNNYSMVTGAKYLKDFTGTISLYNYDTDEYEEIIYFDEAGGRSLKNVDDYISYDNKIRIKYETDDAQDYINTRIPEVAIKRRCD